MAYVSKCEVFGGWILYNEREFDREFRRDRAWRTDNICGMALEEGKITLYMQNGHKVNMQCVNAATTDALYLHLLDSQHPNPLA